MDSKTYISKDGLEKLQIELEGLKGEKRKEVAKRIYEAKELGDLSENAEYADAKNEQAFIEGRILEIENIIKNAAIIDESKIDKSNVSVGSTIDVEFENMLSTYTIVGSNEANPQEGKISNVSPMGNAFIGKKVGESVDIETPKGIRKVVIKNIK